MDGDRGAGEHQVLLGEEPGRAARRGVDGGLAGGVAEEEVLLEGQLDQPLGVGGEPRHPPAPYFLPFLATFFLATFFTAFFTGFFTAFLGAFLPSLFPALSTAFLAPASPS